MKSWTFEDILSPRTESDFLRQFLGRSAAWIEGGPEKFSDLVTWNAVNDLLAFRALTFPRFRLSKAGRILPEDMYFKKSQEGFPRLLVGSVNSLLRDGATATIESVHELHPPLLDLCRDIEHTLMLPIKANLVISWSEPAGCGPQWNGHEMLVLQLHGITRWRVWIPTTAVPTTSVRSVEPTTKPQWSNVLLEAGSLAYIPRGWWWGAETTPSGASLQLVIAFRNPTGLDVIGRLVDQLQASEVMRRDSPRFTAFESQGQFFATIQAELAKVLEEPGVLLGFEKDMWSMSEQLSYFSLPWSVSRELPETNHYFRVISLVRFLGTHSVCHVESEDLVEVFHDGAIVRLTPRVGLVLQNLDVRDSISLQEIFRRCEGEMPRDAVSDALIELVHRGLIALADVDISS